MTSVAVVGPGAIGLTAAAAVIDSGNADLVVCARTGFDEIHVTHQFGEVAAPVDVRTSADGLEPVDLVLLATKVHDTDGAAGFLDALTNSNTTVVVLQNGITQRERVEPLTNGAQVLPCAVQLPANRIEHGVAEAGMPMRLVVPASTGGQLLGDTLAGSFIQVRQSDDFTTDAWAKLALNSASVVQTLAGKPNWIYRDPEASGLRLAVIQEVIAVARAEGATFADDYAEVLHGYLQEKVSGDGTPSILLDRLAGRRTEWRERNQIVVEKAAIHGIDVPVTRILTTLLRLGEPDMTEDQLPQNTSKPN